MSNKIVTFLGCGSWGAALGAILAEKGIFVRYWHRNQSVINEMQLSRKHYLLNEINFNENISFFPEIDSAVNKANVIVLAVPSQHIRAVIAEAKKHIDPSAIIINIAKGIENETLKIMSEVILDVNDSISNYVTLSGPSHAEEVVSNMPTAVVAASKNIEASKIVQDLFSTNKFRVYTNEDLVGVEICGSAKNVIAIAAGFCDGFGYGDNTKSALITRGIKEVARLGLKSGAKFETFFGLAGIGDIIVTCGSIHSRNRMLGERIGRGMTLGNAVGKSHMVVEGVKSAFSIKRLSEKYEIEMPICDSVFRVLYENADPINEVNTLMTRNLKSESFYSTPPLD
mgnify:FL=1|tara:strand:+ start:844 stop:1866 length:1023 start_codon:yes stop_codon:yes gene_type:complete